MEVSWLTSMMGGDERLTSSCNDGVYRGSQSCCVENVLSNPPELSLAVGYNLLAGKHPIAKTLNRQSLVLISIKLLAELILFFGHGRMCGTVQSEYRNNQPLPTGRSKFCEATAGAGKSRRFLTSEI